MEKKEFNLDELDNVFGGLPLTARDDKALENSELYRSEMIEKLKQEKEKLEQLPQENKKDGRPR